jgi:membrane-associated phospholipid phosphatase
MDGLMQRSIEFILALQASGRMLILPMQFFTFLGLENFFFLVLPAVYWCLDSVLGLQIGYLLILSNGLNFLFKLAFHGPRPYWVNPEINPLAGETSFGIPSGHAQNAAGIWGLMAHKIGTSWAYVLGFGIAFLVGFSRLMLGMHFPHDVLAGWLIGLILLLLFVRLWNPISDILIKQSLIRQILLGFAASLILAGLGIGTGYLLRNYELPTEWSTNAQLAGGLTPDPLSLEAILTSSGTLFGFAAGAALIRHIGGFQVKGSAWKRLLRYAIGLAGILILWRGLGLVFPRGEDIPGYMLRYFRYSLVGFWVTFGAPWFYIRFNLAPKPVLK